MEPPHQKKGDVKQRSCCGERVVQRGKMGRDVPVRLSFGVAGRSPEAEIVGRRPVSTLSATAPSVSAPASAVRNAAGRASSRSRARATDGPTRPTSTAARRPDPDPIPIPIPGPDPGPGPLRLRRHRRQSPRGPRPRPARLRRELGRAQPTIAQRLKEWANLCWMASVLSLLPHYI